MIEKNINIPISDKEIELVKYELLSDKDLPNDYRKQATEDIKKMMETHIMPEHLVKKFLGKVSTDYSRMYSNITAFEILKRKVSDVEKPYHEILSASLEKIKYNEELISIIDKVSNTWQTYFERSSRRSRRGGIVDDNTAQLEEQIRGYFKYAIELSKLDKLKEDIMDYDSMLTVTNDVLSEIKSHQLPLEDIEQTLVAFNSSFTTDFAGVKEQIERYNEYMQSYYGQHISPVSAFQSGQDFNFIVHRVTSGFPGTLDFKTPYVSASLITDKTMGLYGGYNEEGMFVDRKGFILSPTNIVSAQYKDTWTGNRQTQTSELFYRQGYAILTPETIEQKCLDIARKANSDQLSENAQIYSEIVTNGFSPQAVFCITNGEGTLNPDYVVAKEQAEKYGLPFIEINQREYRKKANLSPLTQVGEIVLTKEVIQRILPNEIKNINDFYRLREEIMTDDVCKRVSELFNKLSDENTYVEDHFVSLASDIIKEQILSNDLIISGRKDRIISSIDDYLDSLNKNNSIESQKQERNDDTIEQNTVIEWEGKKQEPQVNQRIEQQPSLSDLSIEQLDELKRTGQIIHPIEQNNSNNIHL